MSIFGCHKTLTPLRFTGKNEPFDFSIDVVANTVFGSHETKKLIGT